MKFMRILGTFLCCFVLCTATAIPVKAYEFPSAFWPANDRYIWAVEQGNNQEIIDSVNQIVEILKDEPETTEVMNVMGSRLEQLCLAYERMGQHATTVDYYRRYLYYAQKMGWADAVKIANAKLLQYEPEISLYIASGLPQAHFGAPGEPELGVLHGVTSDGINDLPNESMVLLYHEFGDPETGWMEAVFKEAAFKHLAVEFAWNLPGQGGQVSDVTQQTDHIIQILSIIEKYNSVPVYIRFGAEVNIWGTRADPEGFKAAFRHVANLARQYTTNTAMVWSINKVSSWDIEMNDYYPGDEYVDWVGVSCYSGKYFLGRNDWPEKEKFNEVVFQTGDNADPVRGMREVITKYGGRKPIMLAESGASHTIQSLGEDATDWAKTELERMYHYIPMVYPQVKLIAYFDKTIETEVNDYALTSNQQMKDLYKELVAQPQFIQDRWDGKASITFRKLDQSIPIDQSSRLLPVYAYVHTYGVQQPRVSYYIDDVWVAGSNQIPYHVDLNLGRYPAGSHILRVVAEDQNGRVLTENSYTLQIDHVSGLLPVILDDQQIVTDVPPVTYADRTLVPIRVISEALGFQVDWDEDTQTVTVRDSFKKLSLQINNYTAQVNGDDTMLDAPPKILDDRTLVPIRFISEVMGYHVYWEENPSAVRIIS